MLPESIKAKTSFLFKLIFVQAFLSPFEMSSRPVVANVGDGVSIVAAALATKTVKMSLFQTFITSSIPGWTSMPWVKKTSTIRTRFC